jgi:hypothetical protein
MRNDEMKETGLAYMLKKIKTLETALSVIDDLMYSEIADLSDKVRVTAYKRGLTKAIHTLRYYS